MSIVKSFSPTLPQTLHFIANLDPLDGSAHALYCGRNILSLAKNAPPDWQVSFLHASGTSMEKILSLHGGKEAPTLRCFGLPNLRRGKYIPFHLNAVFHLAVQRHIGLHARRGDILCTASFPEMFRFLATKLSGSGFRLVYEVHQLEIQSRERSHKKCTRELDALRLADTFITTCEPLVEILHTEFPGTKCHNLGLASTYASVASLPTPTDSFKIGYFGSLSSEQGVPWLAGAWKKIRALCGSPVELHIYGRGRRNEPSLPSDPENGVFVCDPIPTNLVPSACADLNALIIPALDQAHRASIAFTKAYDYASLGLPVLASDLPTIREVLEPETHALYFAPGNAVGLATCIQRISNDLSLAATISRNLRQRSAELSWDARACRWWESVLS
jgi:glycosyltransferase involved in cell wall biosynthesis